MPKIPKIKLAAEYLLKLADEYMAANPEEQAHEQGETPEQEVAEHAPGGYEENAVEEGEQALPVADDAEIEKVLSDLSPEELDDLASQLAEDMQHPDEQETDDTAALAQAIQEHLSQNPEAQAPDVSPEKTASLNLIKSAEYIEGFLNEAISHGATVKEAVDLYDSSLVDALSFAKIAEDKKKEIFETLLDNPQSIKEASFLEGFAFQANSSGLNLEQLDALHKTSSSISTLTRAAGEAADAAHAYRYATKKPGVLRRLIEGASETAKKFKSKALEKAKKITDRLSTVSARHKQPHISGISGENARKNTRRVRESSKSFESSGGPNLNRRREAPNPFKPNIGGSASKQRTRTTQDYSKVVKEHEKTASTAAKLLKMLGRKKFNSLVQAVEDGTKLRGFRPAGMKGEAFTKAIEDVRKNHVSAPTKGAPASLRAGKGSAPTPPQTAYDKLMREHAQIQQALREGAIDEVMAADRLAKARSKHLGIPVPPPTPPKPPLTQEEIFNSMRSKSNPKPPIEPTNPKPAPEISPEAAAKAEAQAAAKAEADRQRKIFEEVNARTKPTDPEAVRNQVRKDIESGGMSAEERVNAAEEAKKARNVSREEQEAMDARAKAEQDLKNYREQQAAAQQHRQTVEEAQQAARQAQEELLKQQKIDTARKVINDKGGADAHGRVRGVTRQQQNDLVTDLHGGTVLTPMDTFIQALEGSTDPRMRGITHNLAARMGRAGKTIADNPGTSAAVALGGGLGLAATSSKPEQLPEKYRNPVRKNYPQPLAQPQLQAPFAYRQELQ